LTAAARTLAMTRILLVYDSRAGLVQQVADAVGEGVRTVEGAELRSLRIGEADPLERQNLLAAANTDGYDEILARLKAMVRTLHGSAGWTTPEPREETLP